jgi:hypothetical protein
VIRRATFLIITAFASWHALVAAASGGSYDVLSCRAAPGNENNAWSGSNTAPSHLTVGTVCPPGNDVYAGIRAKDTLGATSAPDGSRAEWTFTAPAGTTITRWRYERYLGKYNDDSWHVYGKLGDGTIFDTCSIPITGDDCWVGAPAPSGDPAAFRDLSGISTDRLVFGFTCQGDGGTCATGATIQHVWAALYKSTVTLIENTLPTVGAPSGALITGSGWHRGAEAVSFTASDGSPGVGIKETRVYVDGQPLASATVARTCDYTLTVPCTDPAAAVSHTVDTTQIADGERQVEVAAVDAAGNVRRATPVTVRIDNGAPSPTILAPVQTPRTDPSMQVTWGGSDGTGSGIANYDVEVSVNGGDYEPWFTGTGATGAVYTGSPGSRYRFRARARDASGLVSGFVASHEVEIVASPPSSGIGGTPPPGPDAGSGGPPPSNGDPSPGARSLPTLRVRRVERRGATLLVTGVVSRAATGRVTATYSARASGRTMRTRAILRVNAGRFRGRLRLGRAIAAAPRARLELRYSGDTRYRPRTVRTLVTR